LFFFRMSGGYSDRACEPQFGHRHDRGFLSSRTLSLYHGKGAVIAAAGVASE